MARLATWSKEFRDLDPVVANLERTWHEERTLLKLLKKIRRELADSLGVPPFIVALDETLEEMVRSSPKTGEEFKMVLRLKGEWKEKYTKDFVEAFFSPAATA